MAVIHSPEAVPAPQTDGRPYGIHPPAKSYAQAVSRTTVVIPARNEEQSLGLDRIPSCSGHCSPDCHGGHIRFSRGAQAPPCFGLFLGRGCRRLGKLFDVVALSEPR
jgi:hypothetical protein